MTDDLQFSLSVPPPTGFWRAEGAELGVAIRSRRNARRWSIDSLAREAGMHPTYLAAIELGKRNPTWAKVSDLAEVLEVPVSVLACEAESRRITDAINALAADAYRAAWSRHRDRRMT